MRIDTTGGVDDGRSVNFLPFQIAFLSHTLFRAHLHCASRPCWQCLAVWTELAGWPAERGDWVCSFCRWCSEETQDPWAFVLSWPEANRSHATGPVRRCLTFSTTPVAVHPHRCLGKKSGHDLAGSFLLFFSVPFPAAAACRGGCSCPRAPRPRV